MSACAVWGSGSVKANSTDLRSRRAPSAACFGVGKKQLTPGKHGAESQLSRTGGGNGGGGSAGGLGAAGGDGGPGGSIRSAAATVPAVRDTFAPVARETPLATAPLDTAADTAEVTADTDAAFVTETRAVASTAIVGGLAATVACTPACASEAAMRAPPEGEEDTPTTLADTPAAESASPPKPLTVKGKETDCRRLRRRALKPFNPAAFSCGDDRPAAAERRRLV